jgi:hypothetical protein
MAGEEDTRRAPVALTEEQAEQVLADMNEVIRAGEEMRRLRADLITLFVGFGWTQDRIAQLTGMSQPAVSKQVAKHNVGESPPSTGLSLDQHDTAWLEGRLWGLGEELADTVDDAGCARYVNALARGRKRLTPQNVDELRRLVEEDLRQHRAEIPPGYQDAYDTISRGLDVPSKVTTTTTASASVRRTLARQLQRNQLRSGY